MKSILALTLSLYAGSAWGHETASGIRYPMLCCSNRDCQPARDGAVREIQGGYLVVATGEVVPYGDRRIKEALDTEIHVCQQAGDFDKGRVLCLFPALRGF